MTGVSARPEREFKVGAVRATIWKNQRTSGAGETFDAHRVHVERTYRDSQGNFQSTDGLGVNDIPKAILALKKAYEYLTAGRHSEEPENGDQHPDAGVTDRIP